MDRTDRIDHAPRVPRQAQPTGTAEGPAGGVGVPVDLPDAGTLARRIARGEASATGTVRDALAAVERTSHLRAFTQVWAEEALELATRIDAALARGTDLPLAGVPLAVKASEGTDSRQAQALIAAGSVPIGSTSVPGPGTEWKTWGRTDAGPTLNPWDGDAVPGGSSAGSAVAVAAGAVPWATASDGAGSTRIPAAWCGVSGYKPTTGLLPARDRAGLTVGGPIARTVADLELYRKVVLGARPAPPPTRIRVAWSRTLGFNDPDPEVAQLAEQTLHRWARASDAVEAVDARVELTDPADSWFARRGDGDVQDHDPVDRRNTRALAQLFSGFSGADLLATPTTPNPPHPHSGPGEVMSVGFTWLFNLTGHPAVSLPAGRTRRGLPVGLHLVAPHHADAALLSAARDAERCAGPAT
ncbi:amidase family protein [Nocardiopsis coralli]|uniref:amidase family protein n=1 Tax=Nocardiopsis coralli TaxID=2772213 RepID=UPI0038B28568